MVREGGETDRQTEEQRERERGGGREEEEEREREGERERDRDRETEREKLSFEPVAHVDCRPKLLTLCACPQAPTERLTAGLSPTRLWLEREL